MIDTNNDVIKRHIVEKSPQKTIGEILKTKLIKPISPSDLESKHCHDVNPKIVQVINDIIREKWNGTFAVVYLDEIEKLCNERDATKFIYPAEIKTLYGQMGWKVGYDYFNASFIFTKSDTNV